MSGHVDAIVRGEVEPGRYRLAAPVTVRSLRDELVAAGWAMRLVDGAAMHDRRSMFDEFAAGCEFPDWFGGNWDALVDCLRDMSWIPGAGVVVLWRRSGAFAAAAPQTWDNVGPIIDDAIRSRTEIGLVPLFVLYPALPGTGRDDGVDLGDDDDGVGIGDRADGSGDDGLSGGGGSMLQPVR